MILNKKLISIFITSLSFLLLLTFIWYKFIRVRLPKEIPFELTEYSFIAILISICLYCFNIRKLFSTSKQDFVDISKIVKNINYYLYKPFTILLSYIIATFPLEFEKYYTKSILKIMSFNLTKFYFYSYVLIRFSIVIVFTIDVLYIHKVYFVYSLTLLVIILLLYRIITYLLEFLRDNAFESIDSKYNIAIIHPAYNQMCFINSQVMVDILSSQLIRKQPLIPFSLIFKYEYLESLRVEYNIDPKVRITSVLDFEDLEVAFPLSAAHTSEMAGKMISCIVRTMWGLRGPLEVLMKGWTWIADSSIQPVASRKGWPKTLRTWTLTISTRVGLATDHGETLAGRRTTTLGALPCSLHSCCTCALLREMMSASSDIVSRLGNLRRLFGASSM